ncbi:heparinase II/III-family protein [Sphingomonas sp. SUN039]|uniref:heparinase II/III family protein n=1 Tax=Sphingomonas sp. SUN039 TaxID=2937787 RepID=UPI002164D44D|nr:heparinase II/III-family protein [Sphingomonas sp. SUN039]UVO52838.1 heparinase II/III-family protein [Sphingomonas sp. SUN039]
MIMLRTLARLGPGSLIDVALYRGGLKLGVHPVFRARPVPDAATGDFFGEVPQLNDLPPTSVWSDRPWAFGRPAGPASTTPPDWHHNVATGTAWPGVGMRWDKVPTFVSGGSDIKTVWEASRFDWVLSLAQSAANGDTTALHRLNDWLDDWVAKNPPYTGPNWVCGQEASIRVTHLLAATVLLGTVTPSPRLLALLLTHLRRIRPTVAYARGQQNNHATSEGMALFMGGSSIALHATTTALRREGNSHARAGRRLLEDRVDALIFEDGGFAQYSVVYHRLMLDSLSLTELWRQRLQLDRFTDRFYRKSRRAMRWLAGMVAPESGDVPNLGSNDGAWLLPIGSGTYRDFRPSVALAARMFDVDAVDPYVGSSRTLLEWLGAASADCPPTTPLKNPSKAPPTAVRLLDDSGIAIIDNGSVRAYMRLPGYRFRPHQADALHLDVWNGDDNSLTDAGTFSYAGENWDYFPSTAAHNTVTFDDRDQMPRLGRFLYGEWLARHDFALDDRSVQCGYRDWKGCVHVRRIDCHADGFLVTDRIEGQFARAVLRWRFGATARLTATGAENDRVAIIVDTGSLPLRSALAVRPVAPYYGSTQDSTVLEIEVDRPVTLTTRIVVR